MVGYIYQISMLNMIYCVVIIRNKQTSYRFLGILGNAHRRKDSDINLTRISSASLCEAK
jgi:hypothetical protein